MPNHDLTRDRILFLLCQRLPTPQEQAHMDDQRLQVLEARLQALDAALARPEPARPEPEESWDNLDPPGHAEMQQTRSAITQELDQIYQRIEARNTNPNWQYPDT